MNRRRASAARTLLEEAEAMEDGDEKVARLAEVVRLADLHRDEQLGFDARLPLIAALNNTGQCIDVYAPFAWCLALCDRKPSEFSEKDLLWEYKWIVAGSEDLPQFPMPQLLGMIDEMKRRYQRQGLSPRPIHRIELLLAMATGRRDRAEEARRGWKASPRDEFTDCRACERDTEVQYLIFAGEDDRAVEAAGPILDGRLKCRSVPRQTYPEVLLPLVRLGRTEEALEYHRKGYRIIKRNSNCVHDAALHLVFLSLAGKLTRAVRMFEYYLPFPRRALIADHADRFHFTLASRFLMERLLAGGRRSVELDLPEAFPPYQESGTYDVETLEAWFRADALRLAARFDARNGTDWFSQLIRQNESLKDLI